MIMHGGHQNTSHTQILPNGYRRGIKELYEPYNFATVPDAVMDAVCLVQFPMPIYQSHQGRLGFARLSHRIDWL